MKSIIHKLIMGLMVIFLPIRCCSMVSKEDFLALKIMGYLHNFESIQIANRLIFTPLDRKQDLDTMLLSVVYNYTIGASAVSAYTIHRSLVRLFVDLHAIMRYSVDPYLNYLNAVVYKAMVEEYEVYIAPCHRDFLRSFNLLLPLLNSYASMINNITLFSIGTNVPVISILINDKSNAEELLQALCVWELEHEIYESGFTMPFSQSVTYLISWMQGRYADRILYPSFFAEDNNRASFKSEYLSPPYKKPLELHFVQALHGLLQLKNDQCLVANAVL